MSKAEIPSSVRVASVQFEARKFASIEEFEQQVRYFVEVAADYGADFVCFPEMFTLCLLSTAPKKLRPKEAVDFLSGYTARFTEFMSNLASSHKINIIGGSHFTRVENGEAQNVCYVFLRNGGVYAQPKIQATPSEGRWWDIKGGHALNAIPTDCGKIGVLICYDSEFPELTRHLADQGALMLFVPFCTDDKQGYNRVRYCAQARPIENQIYVVASGIVGNLPGVGNMDIHYAESCILTPCDFPFARDGVAAIAPANAETVIFADLDMDALLTSREKGTVTNFKDRRLDLYRVEWAGE